MIAYLSLGNQRLDGRPGLTLGSITEQVHDDGTLVDGLIHLEEVLAWNPAVLLGVLPGLTVLSDTNNDIKAIVTHVQGLSMTLGSIADDGHGVILEVLLGSC